ncbi:hypothetical protein DM02DRAFT_259704 [Periconia macrospinosa]|uniref:F-box domain-containing protein n=1 Tax=Periconia macrospinosa TaxID=97972 RepID=A0A2V1D4G4_9PLEO|nr:hypothetical protein DM02DRAFT_259704 [Periconia macrospinosa]
MHRYGVCNLLTTLSYPPWTKGLDRVVYMTQHGEERFPFYAYVQPNDVCTVNSHHNASFWSFSRLPAEIQVHVLAMCPASTLFRLMHTSLKLRTEALKLFWAKADTYFLVDAHWLINKAYPGDSMWDMAFLVQVQNVEIDYSSVLNNRICMRQEDERVEIQSNLVDIFWASLRDRVLNVKRVILNYNEGSTGREYGLDRIPLALRLLVEASPHGIETCVLFLERKQTSRPTTWRTATWRRCLLRRTEQGVWEEGNLEKFRKTILMPPKIFRGPVGSFGELLYQCYTKIPLQRYGLWPLMVEALDRHHFDVGRNEPFPCPVASCTAYFSKGGEWTIYAAEEHY